MNTRERFKCILDGMIPDRTPWSPRLEMWYNGNKNRGTLPEEFRDKSLCDVYKMLGMDLHARKGIIYSQHFNGVEIKQENYDSKTVTKFYTESGVLQETFKATKELQDAAAGGSKVECMVKEKKDYKILNKLIESIEFKPEYDTFIKYDQKNGNDAYPLIHLHLCPIHILMMQYVGYNNIFFHLNDFPEVVEDTLFLMNEKWKELWKIAANSPADFIMYGSHFSFMMTPPNIFKKYFLSHLKEFCAFMHKKGKKVAFHADADLSNLLELVLECGFDLADCLVTYPMAKVKFKDALKIWDKNIAVWGGIPSIILEEQQYSFSDFEKYMKGVFQVVAKYPERIILGVSDNVLPNADIKRLQWITTNLIKY